jgi:pyridinium-3,5-bisthiocarboxylic acid mononucleotide nickel chelatase
MSDRIVVLRTPSGISGDMLVAGLSRLLGDREALDSLLGQIGMPQLAGCFRVEPHAVNAISGWKAKVTLPHEHVHRPLSAIVEIIGKSSLSDRTKALSIATFERLAEAEGAVHGILPAHVEFHEVGALDSIVDICLAAGLLDRIAPAQFHCSPLPLCDGTVKCAHGILATPAPAVQEMLRGVPVYGLASTGETVTPTALAFLLSAGAQFGEWPAMEMTETARVFGGKLLPGVPNGAIFALGKTIKRVVAKPEPHDHHHEHHHH